MIKVIEDALDTAFNDYFFIGREKVERDGKVESNKAIDVGMTEDVEGVKKLFEDLEIADRDMKFTLLDWVLKAFEMSDAQDYAEFTEKVRMMKRQRYTNHNRGLVVW